jgi:hypothetical protein
LCVLGVLGSTQAAQGHKPCNNNSREDTRGPTALCSPVLLLLLLLLPLVLFNNK